MVAGLMGRLFNLSSPNSFIACITIDSRLTSQALFIFAFTNFTNASMVARLLLIFNPSLYSHHTLDKYSVIDVSVAAKNQNLGEESHSDLDSEVK